jgi:hypothetical protein
MKLTDWMKQLGLTQGEVGRFLGVSQDQLGDEHFWPRRAQALRILRLTHGAVTPNDFLTKAELDGRIPADIDDDEPAPPATVVPPISTIDPGRPETWPSLLRENDIVRDKERNWPGLLPISRGAWRRLITDGYVSPGLLLGAKVRAWTREEIVAILTNGVQRRPRGKRALAREAQRRTANQTNTTD